MQSGLFRKKSLDRVSSPEQLQDYMRVTSPGIWLVLAAVIALLAGLIISSALATLESSLPEQAEVMKGSNRLEIGLPLSQKDRVEPGMLVRVGDNDAHVTIIYQGRNEIRVEAELDDPSVKLSPGTYDVQIVLETIKPISFLFNNAGK